MELHDATYSDAHGSEQITIVNDGETLSLSVRGVEFAGADFDLLEPKEATPDQLQQFTLFHGCLAACRIQCRMPVPVRVRDDLRSGWLSIDLRMGAPIETGTIERDELRIVLEYDDQRFAGRGTSGWFEDELLSIQAQLPEGVFIKACINCLYSDYSPYGHGRFGSMMCFRNLKAEYLRVTTKDEFWSVHERRDRLVQETYLCPEFERRVPGTGYRG